MKKRSFWVGLLFACSGLGVQAAPVSLETAQKTAEKFYSVQMQRIVKSVPVLSCIYPKESKSTGFIPYYIFNAEQNQGFVIVAGDDNVTNLVLGYSEKGAFSIENMPDNLRYWLLYYEEGVRNASQNGFAVREKSNVFFSKAEVVKPPLLDSINYNQDAPYNDLCPIDPTTNKRSMTGCVATALASIARYHEYPEKGQGSITYTTPKGSTLTMDFTQNTYDWANMLKEYSFRNLSRFTEVQRSAVATLMRDMGYAVQMMYGSNASGAYRENTVKGIVDYMGFDSILNYRERLDYDNDDQWIAVLKDNIDNGMPVYYTGQGDGGGHAFICDGYDDADFFHFNWGWGGMSNGYFSVRSLDPNNITGIGAGTGGGYSTLQGILHNMAPKGRARSKDEFLLLTVGTIEPKQKEDSIYDIDEEIIEVPFTGFKNRAMSLFKGKIALAAFKDGEFIRIVSDTQRLEVIRQGTITKSFSLHAKLDSLDEGSYDLWTVCRSDGGGSHWQKVYANKASRYTNDSYIPVRINGKKFELVKTMAELTVSVECDANQYISMLIYVDNELLGRGQVSRLSTSKFNIRQGEYDLRFGLKGYDTAYVDLKLTKDTAITVSLHESYFPPDIIVVRVKGNTSTLGWKKNPRTGEIANPSGFALYLDSVEVAQVPVTDEEYMEYVYTNIPLGKHWIGIRSLYKTGQSEMQNRYIVIKSVANEKSWEGVCRIGPNPSADGFFMLEVDRDCKLQVCALSGNVLFERSLNAGSHQVDMGGYSSGVYLFRLSGRNGESALLKAVLR
ncbi:MAG: C10 family peptidase [Bacteroides sp.]|nr:C10 family peptidase [Ruminococcus flavefaciens]MCM1555716.1 C10 family peptidase [Bacteroides sp.]